MFKKVVLIGICCFIVLSQGCFNNDLPFVRKLQIPYHSQDQNNYCAVACIQMWADYQGECPTQSQIASFLGVQPTGLYPDQIVQGVRQFTPSWGFLAQRCCTEPGAQGDLIGGIIAGIDRGFPAIMPFYEGTHTVIVRGFEWYEENYKPIATVMYYHDPDPFYGANQIVFAYELESYCFTPAQGNYYAIVASSSFVEQGIDGHNYFILSGGTYYGGPSFYDPKGISLY